MLSGTLGKLPVKSTNSSGDKMTWNLRSSQSERGNYDEIAVMSGRNTALVLCDEDLIKQDPEHLAFDIFEADLKAGLVDVDDVNEARARFVPAFKRGYEEERTRRKELIAARKDLEAITGIIEENDQFAYGIEDPKDVAKEWAGYHFNSEETRKWLKARCYKPEVAWLFQYAGITPEQAGHRTDEGSGGYVDTIAYKVCIGDLEGQDAVRLTGANHGN